MPAIATEQNKRMSWDEMVKEYPDRSDAELLLKAAHQAKSAEITAKAASFGKEAER